MKQSRLTGVLVGVALLWLASGAWAQVTISNLVVAQRTGTKLVDISYDLSSPTTNVFVTLSVSNAGNSVEAVSLTGDVGITGPGSGKAIVWDMSQDWSENAADLTFKLKAQLPDYMVVDLSEGVMATNYQISHTEVVPEGGWSDGFKTTNMIFQRIPAGVFVMGSPTNELGRNPTNETQRTVTLTMDYYVGMYEVTQKQWERVMGTWPSYFTNAAYRDTRPVETVSYDDIRGAAEGTNWPANNNVDSNSFMGALRNKTGLLFDLPTEAQWEYACRAGTTNALNSGYDLTSTSNDARMAEVGRYYFNGGASYTENSNTNEGSALVGSYLPNAWGLYDMHGNIWEFCIDWYETNNLATTDPFGAVNGVDRVKRGGGWASNAGDCRSGFRRGNRYPSYKANGLGFRVSLLAIDSAPQACQAAASVWVDSRNYRLTVNSTRGSPSPVAGASYYPRGASTTCSVSQTTVVAGISWRCTGWVGTGSIPAAGSTNTTGLVVLTNLESSITWNWETSFIITNLLVAQRPGTKLVDITYDIVSEVTNGVPIALSIDNADVPVQVANAAGDFGAHVLPGAGKTIVWDAGSDWGGNTENLTFTVSAHPPDYMVVDVGTGSAAASYPVTYLNSVPGGGWSDGFKTTNLVLRRIPAGTFTMGSPTNELGRDSDELQHEVTLTKDCYIGLFEVTQKQWELVMGTRPSYFTNATYRDTRPVETISYGDIRGAVEGTNWPANGNVDTNSFMGLMRAKTGQSFDLPTEAQWEYACRAGTTNALNSGFDLTSVSNDVRMAEVGRYYFNGGSNNTSNVGTNGGTAKAGSYMPNACGVYDMHGNVFEWCLDWYTSSLSAETDPDGPVQASVRVIRGGAYVRNANKCRSANRETGGPTARTAILGVRVNLPLSYAATTDIFGTATAVIDTRDYRLMVITPRATPTPGVGTNLYAWRASVTCSVAQTSLVSGVNWSNTGWTGTGSIPASGVTTNTGLVVLTNVDSSITWNWETSFGGITNVEATQRAGTKLVDITYDIVSDVTNSVPIALTVTSNGVPIPTNATTGAVGTSVLPGTGRVMTWNAGANWNGNVGSLVFLVKHLVETQFVSSTSRTIDTRDYKLAVASAQGTPSPAVGTNLYAWGSSVTCSVARTSLVAGVNWRCTGWTGTGSVPSTGSTNTTSNVALTGLVSSITWNWQTSFRITNVVAAQQIGAKTVVITYDIVSDVSSTAPISLVVTSNGVVLATNGLTGDVGANVSPGAGKTITWNAGPNWNGNVATLAFSVRHTSQTQLFSSASGAVDSRDYKLTVVSPRGSPAPPAGTNLYAWRTTILCTVAPTTTVSGVRWRNTGWTGTGSIPASGTTNTTGAVTLSNTSSTITWNWVTPFAITNVAAVQRPGTKLVDITYDIISELGDTVPIALVVASNGVAIPTNGLTGDFGSSVPPGAGKALVWDAGSNWNGNAATLDFTVRHSSQTQFVALGSCQVDSRDYKLVVTSSRGCPTPSNGENLYPWCSTVACMDVQTSYVDGIKWRNTGWTGTGSIPATGATNTTGSLVLTNPVSSITWNWEPWFLITNIAQRPGTKIVDIQYDISSAATNVYISLAVSNGEAAIAATNLSGHVGNVVPGMGKSIAWNMGTDWNGNLAELSFTLSATPPDYLVVDLSQGSAATNYPVSYPSSIPVGGWSDSFKTTNLVLRRIPAGTYTMGSPTNELGRLTNEMQHTVTLTKDYYIGVYEVTQKHWERVMDDWPSFFTNAAYREFRPVEQVSYNDIRGATVGTNWPVSGNVDANSFVGMLRQKTGLRCDLPTEAQWEYACRAGTTNALNSGYDLTSTSNDLRVAEVGRYSYNGGSSNTSDVDTNGGTDKVGSYMPNAWGLYDLHGNVWELCLDWYADHCDEATDPSGTDAGSNRMVRGGSYISIAKSCRSAYRYSYSPSQPTSKIGFRIAIPASQTTTASRLLDSRDYKLSVVSARGTPVPAVGTNIYAWRASVTCSVARTTLVSGVCWSNTGWTGTGSIPDSGATTNTGLVVLTNVDSSITWNWDTAFSITNVTAVQRPGTKIVDIVYDLLSDMTNYVTISLAIENSGVPVPTNGITGAHGVLIYPGLAKTIVWNAGTYWNGNVADLGFAVFHRTTTQLVGTCTGHVDTRSYSLAVASPRGSPSPPAGTNSSYSWSATVTATVRNVAGYTMTGWTGTGSVPATGLTTNTGPIVLTDLVSSIVWNWTTNDYTVTFDARGGTAPNPASKVVTYATAYGELPSTAREYYHFAGWWTDPVSGSLVTSNTTMNSAYNRTLFAHWTIYAYPVTLHPGVYGRIVEANSNQSYVTSVDHGAALPSVTIVPYAGYSFTGWSPADPGAIVTNFEATAQYSAISPPIYDVGVGSVSITNNGNYIITGSTISNTISVATGIQANITLINVSVVLSNGCAFHINGNSSVNLTLLGTGTNRFTSCADHAGIHLTPGSTLSIMSNSTATLIAQGGSGGAGIGGGQGEASGTIDLHGGMIQATGGLNAAGIGGGSGGACNYVAIEGTAHVDATGGDYGPGIGSGYGGATNLVTIGGSAVVQARGGSAGGAGLGGGQRGSGGTILIGDNASVAATGGLYSAGIGGGSGGSGGNVTIGGNAVVAGTGGDYGAGIGGGLSGPGGTVLIADSSTVTATGATGAAGIGGGFGGAGGTIDIYALATIRAGADVGSAVVVGAYGGEAYVHIVHLATPGLAIMSATGSNFVFSAESNGYSGYAVEWADCVLLPGGVWNWRQITNHTVNPDGSISVPLESGGRKVIRLKLTP